MLYETSRQLTYQSYQQWISTELFSLGWFIIIAVLAITYSVWIKLLDTSKLRDLLLLGSLSAVGFLISNIVLFAYFGVLEYKIRLLPLHNSIFTVSITLAPILYMLVQQYTSSWKSYASWSVIGTAVLAFGLLPIYSLLGILQLHNWNYFYHFLLMFTDGMVARALLLWAVSLEKSQSESSRVPSMFSALQPAVTKPLHKEKEDTIDNED